MKIGGGRNSRAIVAIVLAFICIIFNWHYRLFAVRVKNCPQCENFYSLMSFNVDATDSIRFDIQYQGLLKKLIESEEPDILCFQELSFENLKKIKNQLDSIYGSCLVLKGDDQLWRLCFYSHFPLRNFSRGACQSEIDLDGLNEQEIEEAMNKKKQMGVMSAELEVEPGHWVTVFSGQLRSSAYSTARRSMAKGSSWIEGLPLYWRNYRIGKRIRDYEAENLRRLVDDARISGQSVIVVGDLNDWCGSDCLNTLMGDDLKDAWWEGGFGFGWTYFGWHLRLRLDHILYSDDLELIDVKVIDTDLSDHKPLIARFRLR